MMQWKGVRKCQLAPRFKQEANPNICPTCPDRKFGCRQRKFCRRPSFLARARARVPTIPVKGCQIGGGLVGQSQERKAESASSALHLVSLGIYKKLKTGNLYFPATNIHVQETLDRNGSHKAKSAQARVRAAQHKFASHKRRCKRTRPVKLSSVYMCMYTQVPCLNRDASSKRRSSSGHQLN